MSRVPKAAVSSLRAVFEAEEISTAQPKIELYLSKDILQGEKVPFYIVWNFPNVDNIKLEFNGFTALPNLYNVKRGKEVRPSSSTIRVSRSNLKGDGYLGGVLSTTMSKTAKETATLIAEVECTDGSEVTLKEERILHSTRAKIEKCPDKFDLPLKKGKEPIVVKLSGDATVKIGIARAKNGLEIGLRPDVLSVIERFTLAAVEGLDKLSEDYPQYEELLKEIINPKNLSNKNVDSVYRYTRYIETRLRSVTGDSQFMEALAYVLVTAIISESGMRDSVLVPLSEYLESNAAVKAFLNSPFLCINVPAEGGKFRCWLEFKDLLEHRCQPSILVDTFVYAKEATQIPIKELVKFVRES